MSMYGKDWEYANSRLHETIVRIGEEPVYICAVAPGMIVQYAKLTAMETLMHCGIDAFNLQPVPLGYCNYNKYAGYLSRLPMRRDWRQGLRRGNFVCVDHNIDPNRLPYEALRQAIVGDYPTFTGVLEAIKKVKSIAWHRHWCIDNGLKVYYKGGLVPVGEVENSKVVLTPSYTYLTEALSEVV